MKYLVLLEPVGGPPSFSNTLVAPVVALAFSPSGDRCALALANGKLGVMERRSHAERFTIGPFKDRPRALAYLSDDVLAVALEGFGAGLLDSDTGRARSALPTRGGAVAFALPPALAVGPDGAHAYVASAWDQGLAQSTPLEGEVKHRLVGLGHAAAITGMAHVSSGIVTTARDRGFRLWREDRHAGAAEVDPAEDHVLAAAGDRLFVAAGRKVQEQDLAIHQTVTKDLKVGVLDVDVHPGGGALIFAGSDGHAYTVSDLRSESGRCSPMLEGPVTVLRFAGERVVAIAGETLHLLDEALQRVAALEVGPVLRAAVAVSADRVALGRANGSVLLVRIGPVSLEVEDLREAHPGAVTACAWSPDGRLATASRAGDVRVGSRSISLAPLGGHATALRFVAGDLMIGTARTVVLRARVDSARQGASSRTSRSRTRERRRVVGRELEETPEVARSLRRGRARSRGSRTRRGPRRLHDAREVLEGSRVIARREPARGSPARPDRSRPPREPGRPRPAPGSARRGARGHPQLARRELGVRRDVPPLRVPRASVGRRASHPGLPAGPEALRRYEAPAAPAPARRGPRAGRASGSQAPR